MQIRSMDMSAEAGEYTTAKMEVYLHTKEDKEMMAEVMAGKGSGDYKLVDKKTMEYKAIDAKALDSEVLRKMVTEAAEKEFQRKVAHLMTYEKIIRPLDGLVSGIEPSLYQRDRLHTDKIMMFSTPRQSGKTMMDEYSMNLLTNPCSEIMMTDNNTPHSQRVTDGSNSSINVQGRGITAKLTFTDETMLATISIPGVAPERVEMRQIDNRLRIRINPLESELKDVYGFEQPSPVREVTIVLTAEEEVIDTKLALGVLEISIDRGREVQDFAIDVVSE